MHMPFLRRYFPTQPTDGTAERLLDNEYQLERISASDADTSSLAEYLRATHDAERDLSIAVLQAAAGKTGTRTIAALHAALTAPKPISTSAFAPADAAENALAARLLRLRERGTQIARVLTSPAFSGGESQLLTEASRALKNGMTSTGRDQGEEFKDSLQLFREAQEGAIGNRNYVVWFQIGWILWKQGASLSEAEEAFYQAYRLSAATQDIFYYSSQRHRAYLQFLQNKPGDACATIARAATLYPDDPDVLRDAARYAAAAGQTGDAANFLRESLRVEPAQAETVFAETAFAPMLPALADAVWDVFESGERDAVLAVGRLANAATNIGAAATRSGVTIQIADNRLAGIADAQGMIGQHVTRLSYPSATVIVQTATAQTDALYEQARTVLEAASIETEQQLNRPRKQIERLLFDQKKWKEDVSKLERAARQSSVNLAAPPKRGLFGRYNPEHASLYENYQTARGQAELNAKRIADEIPIYQADIERGEVDRANIAQTTEWLAAQHAG